MKPLTLLLIFALTSNLSFANRRNFTTRLDSDEFATSITGLPAFDRVDLVAIVGLPPEVRPDCSDPSVICGSGRPYRILARRSLTGDFAAELGNYWRNLRPGNGMGCYSPAYIFRFYAKDQLIVEAEVCFHCQYVLVYGQGRFAVGGGGGLHELFEFVNEVLPYPEANEAAKGAG
jgi:hypothetical protein